MTSIEELFGLIASSSGNLLVVDVRGKDFKGGHVPGALHFMSRALVEAPEDLFRRCCLERVTRVVFYCMYSIQRAPGCACEFAAYLQRWKEEAREEKQEQEEHQCEHREKEATDE